MTDWDLTPDHRRRERLGFDEAIYCAGKSTDQIRRLLEMARRVDESALLTRLSPEQHAALPRDLTADLDYDPLSGTGLYGRVPQPEGEPAVVVVSGGSSDVPVAREAVRTLRYYATPCTELHDVGVAGLWRLLERIDAVRGARVVIAVAGMEGALPSVVGGLVPGLVVAVPTSTGYGVAAEGRAALNAALSSCAPGLVVVNVDNGYGAACAALRVLRAGAPGEDSR